MSEWRVAVLAILANFAAVVLGLLAFMAVGMLAVFIVWLLGQSI